MNRGKSAGLSRESIFRLRGLLPVPIILVIYVWSNPTVTSLAYGGLTLVVGEAIRLWAAGFIKKYRVSEVQADELVTAGPYAFVRNPLYWGNFLIGLGFVIMANWWPAYLLFAAMYTYVYSSVIPLEEEYLQESFKDDYTAYRAEVPRLAPRLTPYPKARGRFSLRVAVTGELLTIAVHLVIAGAFLLKLLL